MEGNQNQKQEEEGENCAVPDDGPCSLSNPLTGTRNEPGTIVGGSRMDEIMRAYRWGRLQSATSSP